MQVVAENIKAISIHTSSQNSATFLENKKNNTKKAINTIYQAIYLRWRDLEVTVNSDKQQCKIQNSGQWITLWRFVFLLNTLTKSLNFLCRSFLTLYLKNVKSTSKRLQDTTQTEEEESEEVVREDEPEQEREFDSESDTEPEQVRGKGRDDEPSSESDKDTPAKRKRGQAKKWPGS